MSNSLITGDTGSGKSTTVLLEILQRPYKKIAYISTRTKELYQKFQFLSKHRQPQRDYIYLHTEGVMPLCDYDSDKKPIREREMHLFTVEKFLLWYAYQNLFNKDSPVIMDAIVLDEIDRITDNSKYELLLSILSYQQTHLQLPTDIFAISAVIDKKSRSYLKRILNIPGELVPQKKLNLDAARVIHKLPFRNRKIRSTVIPRYSGLYSNIVDICITKAYANHRDRHQTLILFPSKRQLAKMTTNPLFYTHYNYDYDAIKGQFKNPILRQALRQGIGIVYAGLNDRETNLIIDLFQEGKLKLILCTNVIESGIDIRCDAMIVVETPQIQWKTGQWINFIGRVGRHSGKGEFYAIVDKKKYSAGWTVEREIEKGVRISSSLHSDDILPFMEIYPELHAHTLHHIEKKKVVLLANAETKRIALECAKNSIPFRLVKRGKRILNNYLKSPNEESLLKSLKHLTRIKNWDWSSMYLNEKKLLCYHLQFLHDAYPDNVKSQNCLNQFLGSHVLRLNDKDYKTLLEADKRFNYYTLRRLRLL